MMTNHTMIRTLFIGATLFFSSFSARALSPIEFGIKGGMNGSSFRMENTEGLSSLSSDGNVGFQLGLMSQVSLGPIYLQPEIVYGSNRFRFEGPADSRAKIAVNTLNVPVLVGFKLLFLRFFAGPDFNVLTETNVKNSDLPYDFSSNLYKSTVGFQLGAGVKLLGIDFDVRYGGQFKRPTQAISYGSTLITDVKTRMNVWQLNIGYFF